MWYKNIYDSVLNSTSNDWFSWASCPTNSSYSLQETWVIRLAHGEQYIHTGTVLCWRWHYISESAPDRQQRFDQSINPWVTRSPLVGIITKNHLQKVKECAHCIKKILPTTLKGMCTNYANFSICTCLTVWVSTHYMANWTLKHVTYLYNSHDIFFFFNKHQMIDVQA